MPHVQRVDSVQHVIKLATVGGSMRASHAAKRPDSHTNVRKTVPDPWYVPEAATLAFLNAVNRGAAGAGQPHDARPHDAV